MRKFYSLVILIIVFISLNSCNKDADNPVTPPPTSGTNTATYTSTNGGTFGFDNVEITVLPNTVPTQSNGSPGSVIFSIETSSTLESGISPLPGGFALVGKYVKIGPDGFVFKYPVNCLFPASSESSPSGLAIARYQPSTQTWNLVPASYIDSVNKKLGLSSLTLGYFAVVRIEPAGDKAPESIGGMKYGYGSDEWHTITIATVSFKYPSQASWYGGTLVGHTFSSGSSSTGNSALNPCKAMTPQGTYSVWISKTYRVYGVYKTFTYSIAAPVSIAYPLTWSGWGSEATGYVDIVLPSGGDWVEGYPTNWPPPTSTYGSGLFQSTLTWVNTAGTVVDLDMHLYGPNNMHVFYSSKVFGDSIFVLDRDWTVSTGVGNAVENIYNKRGTMPTGAYSLKVNYFGGTGPKPFNCRILLNGSVIASYSGSLSSGTVTIKEFNL